MDTIQRVMDRRGDREDRSRVATESPQPMTEEERRLQAVTGSPGESEQAPHRPSVTSVQPLDQDRMATLGLITPGSTSRVAEEFRQLKRPLIRNAFGPLASSVQRGNVVMTTSAMPREGKTFCAINLALSISREIGVHVMLVDADVARPSIPRYLGIEGSELGLLDVVGGHVPDLSDVIIRTDIPNLSIVPAGRNYRQSTELLASDAMAALTESMAHRYPDRIILFDSPPLLATTEASVLATHMGQVVMVVEAMRTPQSAVSTALDQLAECEVVLTLLNRMTRLPGLDYGYGYGYYGSYGNYQRAE